VLRIVPVVAIVLVGRRHTRFSEAWLNEGRRRDLGFLLAVVVGPVLLHLMAALVLGTQLRDVWGMPLWTFVGVLIVFVLRIDPSPRLWVVWAVVAGMMGVVTLAGNRAGSALHGKPLRIHYPGRELSREVCRRWRQRFGTDLPVVAGDWWLAGCVCIHAPHRPTLYGSREPAFVGMDPARVDGDPARFVVPEPINSPWTGDGDLVRRGGVLVWDADAFGDDLPGWLKRRFPGARVQNVLEMPFAGKAPGLLRVGWALMVPDRGNCVGFDVPLPIASGLSTITNRLMLPGDEERLRRNRTPAPASHPSR
jgi:hypothetical protein